MAFLHSILLSCFWLCVRILVCSVLISVHFYEGVFINNYDENCINEELKDFLDLYKGLCCFSSFVIL